MIVAELKPYDEIKSYLKGCGSVLVAGCGTCTSICHSGGLRETDAVASRLSLDTGMKVKSIVIERQCDDEFVAEIEYILKGVDAVLSLGCGAGVQLIAEMYQGIRVYPGLNTEFAGTSHDRGIFIERCRLCGNCMLGSTAGICPLTRCAKGLQNGPCGGSENGKCETGDARECAWCLIIERMKAQGRLDELYSFAEPVKWPGQAPGRYNRGIGVK
jgi:ferredoxin